MLGDSRLWAPWRLGYVRGEGDEAALPEPSDWPPGAETGCFLCRAAARYSDPISAERALLVIERTEDFVLLLNRYPYANGHLLAAPVRHVASLEDLLDSEHLAIQQALARMTTVLSQRMGAEGFNIGLNLGRVGGAGVPGHLHWHLVPRWQGDHNFMPTLAGVRVIPQSLEAAWELLRG